MKKNLLTLSLILLLFASCKEKTEVDDYADWKSRNEHYVDSIATLARSGADGWSQLPAYNLSDSLGTDGPTQYYVYVQKLDAEETALQQQESNPQPPLYNDSVRVHYNGRLLPTNTYPQGYQFDKSYAGSTLNPATDVPSLMACSGVVTGFGTALMHMTEGEHWRVVIPSYLGYGSSGSSSGNIPAYSTLLFDLHLARIYRYQIDTNTSWW